MIPTIQMHDPCLIFFPFRNTISLNMKGFRVLAILILYLATYLLI